MGVFYSVCFFLSAYFFCLCVILTMFYLIHHVLFSPHVILTIFSYVYELFCLSSILFACYFVTVLWCLCFILSVWVIIHVCVCCIFHPSAHPSLCLSVRLSGQTSLENGYSNKQTRFQHCAPLYDKMICFG